VHCVISTEGKWKCPCLRRHRKINVWGLLSFWGLNDALSASQERSEMGEWSSERRAQRFESSLILKTVFALIMKGGKKAEEVSLSSVLQDKKSKVKGLIPIESYIAAMRQQKALAAGVKRVRFFLATDDAEAEAEIRAAFKPGALLASRRWKS